MMQIALIAGAVGGLVKTVEKIGTLDSLKDVEGGKVIRNIVLGAVGGAIAYSAMNVSDIVLLGVAGYFGEKLIRSVLAVGEKALLKK